MGNRTTLLRKEREMISRIHGLINKRGLLRASIVRMRRKCGNKSCRCSRGYLHESWYLYQSKKGKSRMLYVPNNMAKDIKSWVKKNKDIREALDQLSQLYWERIKRREL